MNDSIVYEVGNDYHIKVFYSLDFEERWGYFTNKFIINEHESLVEIKNIPESMVISSWLLLRFWDKIYKVANKDRLLLDTYQLFPENPGVVKFGKGICSMYLI